MNLPLLEIKNLSISFGNDIEEHFAVSGISFSIEKGETLGVVGESGSGKSLTSLATIGLLPKSAKIKSGSILFQQGESSIDVLKQNENQLRKLRGNEIAMIFQEPMTSLNPVITCGEQVAEAIRLHMGYNKTKAKEEAIKWFNEVQLPRAEQLFDAYPHQISGGQKQRVMIAMAMCCEPKLLIADEPTTALDVTVQKHILQLIKSLQKKHNMGVVFITHDLGVVAEIADKVIVMQAGTIVEQNTTRNIFKYPAHPYTKGLLACRPPLDYRLKRLPIVQDFLTAQNKEISTVFNEIKISNEERTSQLKELYHKPKLIEVRNLKTYFPIQKGLLKKTVDHVKAVDDISFDVYEGETLGLVGESGCGKTTLGRSVLQLIRPTSGEVIYKNTNLRDLTSKELRPFRKDLQIIFQDPYSSLNPRMRVGDAIVEPMSVHNVYGNQKVRKEKVIDLMETVGLKAEQFNRYPHEFSGGQRQRICIARALALSPKFIICDESVSALDVSVQAQVLNLLNDLKQQFNFTYIFISHDLSVVKYMSDRIVVMNQGKVEEIGISEDVYDAPQKEYTKKLIAAIPKGEEIYG
ncbi:MAG: ABC transporter ATP-binding protein [Bacteroidetes bacterium]|nr:MAG: ABC transporter ATP-binding protein [Bacteroidota bacterium]MBL1144858.1 ABC transporter ATP-binding protein [Bacteroidota bacterium]MCB0803894.1 ABC transporter ATP-binding protein [Flavobacteriales bacterium]NOG57652.1 ABC transporter ATP-binding protein [Bacteroidota bacterium]